MKPEAGLTDEMTIGLIRSALDLALVDLRMRGGSEDAARVKAAPLVAEAVAPYFPQTEGALFAAIARLAEAAIQAFRRGPAALDAGEPRGVSPYSVPRPRLVHDPEFGSGMAPAELHSNIVPRPGDPLALAFPKWLRVLREAG